MPYRAFKTLRDTIKSLVKLCIALRITEKKSVKKISVLHNENLIKHSGRTLWSDIPYNGINGESLHEPFELFGRK